MEAKQIQVKTLILSLAAILCVEAAMGLVASKGLFGGMLALGAARLVQIVLMLLIVLIWGRGLSSIGLAGSKILFGFKKGLIWSAVFGVAVFLAFILVYLAGINPLPLIHAHLPTRQDKIILFFLIGGLLAPVAEEVFFRGMLYGFFRRWGVVVALVLSTFLFMLAHLVNSGFPVTQMVGGILFAVAYEVEGSLMAPITIHALGNIAIFTVSLVI